MKGVSDCPYCRGTNCRPYWKRKSKGFGEWVWQVSCHSCKVKGPVNKDKPEAIAMWNKLSRRALRPMPGESGYGHV